MIQELEKTQLFKKGRGIFRTELFKFAELNIQNIAGVPAGQWPEGSMFANVFDKLFYISTNYKRTETPDLLWLKFNGNTQDYSSKLSKIQANTSGSPNYNTGQYGKGLELDGSDDKVTLSGFNLDTSKTNTFSFWIKPEISTTNGEKIYVFETYIGTLDFFLIRFTKTAAGTNPVLEIRWQKTGIGRGH